MFKNKREVILFVVLAAAAFFMTVGINEVFAETITLPNGQEVPLDGLSSNDKQQMMQYIDKISKAQKAAKEAKSTMADTLKEVAGDPAAVNEWRQVITGTIKDIANDLNVSVNEFIKTPAGMGVAALIIYKVAGKDFIGAAVDIVLAIPMWITVMLVLWYIQRQYLTTIVVYNKIVEDEDERGKKRVVRSNPEQVSRYDWNSNDARTVLAAFVYGSMVVITMVCILIVFVF